MKKSIFLTENLPIAQQTNLHAEKLYSANFLSKFFVEFI